MIDKKKSIKVINESIEKFKEEPSEENANIVFTQVTLHNYIFKCNDYEYMKDKAFKVISQFEDKRNNQQITVQLMKLATRIRALRAQVSKLEDENRLLREKLNSITSEM